MVVRASSKSRVRRSNKSGVSTRVALLCCSIVVAGFIARNGSDDATASSDGPMVVAEFDTVQVPVPSSVVPPGTKVKDINFTWMPFPKHQLSPGALTDLGEFLEDSTTSSLPANIPLLEIILSGKNL